MDVHVKSSNSERNKRVVPLNTPVDEETEANLLRFIINFYQYPVKRAEVLDRFNANIPYSGLNYSVSQDVSLIGILSETFDIERIHFCFRHSSLRTKNASSQPPSKPCQPRTPIQMLLS